MTMNLDKRQRAMLREMGVRVWQPLSPAAVPVAAAPTLADAPLPAVEALAAHAAVAIDAVAARAHSTGTAATPPSKPAPPAQVVRQEARPDARPDSGPASWRIADALPLYADAASVNAAPTSGARWLVLAETPAAALQAAAFNPFDGDAGKLLDNMLRAARLHQAGAVMLAPLVRRVAAGTPSGTDLSAALAALLASAQPDVVLVMGRMAAQALLDSSEPFGRLRGQVHSLHGIKTIVTHDAAYLLRTQADKAKAWEDLCLAMQIAQDTGGLKS